MQFAMPSLCLLSPSESCQTGLNRQPANLNRVAADRQVLRALRALGGISSILTSTSCFVVFFVLTSAPLAADEPTQWTAKGGQSVQASFFELAGEYVRLRQPNGRVVRVVLDQLAPKDQQRALDLGRADAAPALAKSPYQPKQWTRPRLSELPEGRNWPDFYQRHIDCHGVPIIAAKSVNPKALEAAHYWMQLMMSKRPELMRELALAKVRVAIVGAKQVMTDIPEYSNLTPRDYWNEKTRSISADGDRLTMSAAEENLRMLKEDMYAGEQLFVHEFAHTIHQVALARVDPKFNEHLEAAYEAALEDGLWERTHAATSHREYLAEGVQIWYHVNGVSKSPDGTHGPIATRAQLKKYDPRLAKLIGQIFP